jgi:tetratricopeptide (TPR) repeat protein
MNQERLNEIYRNPVTINNSDVDDLRQLAKDYPYFSKPFEILARYYYQTNHYRFEEMLRQAAIRVSDRKLLYEFIHSEVPQAQAKSTENIVEPEDTQIAIIEKFEPEDTKLGLDAFLTELEVAPQAEELETKEELELGSDETVETPFEFEGTFKLHETVNTPEEQDIIGEEIATEFSFTKSFVQNETADESQLPEVEDEVVSIESELETEEEEAIELITEEETEEEIATEDLIEDEEIEAVSENTELEKGTPEVSNKNSELDLRKYPVYSIETFVPQTEEQASTETDSSKDFFSWLKNPKHAEETAEIEVVIEAEPDSGTIEKVSKSLDIIEKFISINPQISRPKKEFFSPENMAKRSEVLDLEFVSETLAEIYYQQGNFDFAIKAYEKLSLQNPAKQAFFADLIDKIKKERK